MNTRKATVRSFRIRESILNDITDDVLKAADCKSINEFAGDALQFYTDYLKNKKAGQYLTNEIRTVLAEATDRSHEEMKDLLYKNTVATVAMIHTLAYLQVINEKTLYSVMRKAEEEVQGLRGKVDFEKIFYFISRL